MKTPSAEKLKVGSSAYLREQARELRRELRRQTGRIKKLTLEAAKEQEYREAVQAELSKFRAAPSAAYQLQLRRIRNIVRTKLPQGATVLVVSKGDPGLIRFHQRTGWHFPQLPDGTYAAFYPGCSLSAIAQFEVLRSNGADYMLFPASTFWWRDKYSGFYRHIERRYREVVHEDDTCVIFGLRESGPWIAMEEAIGECRNGILAEPAVLDNSTGRGLAEIFAECNVFAPPALGNGLLPYFSNTIDIVAVNARDKTRLEEARRVASRAVVEFHDRPGGRFDINVVWQAKHLQTAPLTVSIILVPGSRVIPVDRLDDLMKTLPSSFAVEIIAVEDAGTRKTRRVASLARRYPQVKIVTNRANVDFRTRAMTGAKAAAGEILVFVSNEGLPLPGWLPPLLQLFSSRSDAGAIGGRLLRPDFSLHEAGSITNSDGSVTRFGEGDFHPDAARYGYVRSVDFCSETFFATRRALFHECGGFAGTDVEASCHSMDYCARIRSRGYRVYYQPESCCVYLGSTQIEGGPQ